MRVFFLLATVVASIISIVFTIESFCFFFSFYFGDYQFVECMVGKRYVGKIFQSLRNHWPFNDAKTKYLNNAKRLLKRICYQNGAGSLFCLCMCFQSNIAAAARKMYGEKVSRFQCSLSKVNAISIVANLMGCYFKCKPSPLCVLNVVYEAKIYSCALLFPFFFCLSKGSDPIA